MSGRGRKPKPSTLKRLEGNPGKRPLNAREPQPARGIPACPAYLALDAKREWLRVTPELHRLGLLTLIDGAALEAYCEAYALLVKAARRLHREGITVISVAAGEKRHPAATIFMQAAAVVRSYCSEFGLTPSTRSRMTIPGDPNEGAEDEMEQIMGGLKVVKGGLQ